MRRITGLLFACASLVASPVEALKLNVTSPGGWRIVGINPNAWVYYIKPSTAKGNADEMTVDLLSVNPDRVKQKHTRLHVECSNRVIFQSVLKMPWIKNERTPIAPKSTWHTIARLICPAGSYVQGN